MRSVLFVFIFLMANLMGGRFATYVNGKVD